MLKPSAGLTLKFTAFLAAVAGGLAVSSGSAVANSNSDTVDHACRVTMNFVIGTAEYDDCLNVLMDAQVEARRDVATQQRISRCIANGLEPGTPNYATCLLGNDIAS